GYQRAHSLEVESLAGIAQLLAHRLHREEIRMISGHTQRLNVVVEELTLSQTVFFGVISVAVKDKGGEPSVGIKDSEKSRRDTPGDG
ncbi:hypothetical protein GUG51_25810, partial [Xanthomonas citri pv. citri]|nr:hypothetical protein [Xanthomonas citri pv. citri]